MAIKSGSDPAVLEVHNPADGSVTYSVPVAEVLAAVAESDLSPALFRVPALIKLDFESIKECLKHAAEVMGPKKAHVATSPPLHPAHATAPIKPKPPTP